MKLSFLSLVIAAYAAILSTLNYLAQRREKQSRIIVTLNSGIRGIAPGIASDGDLFIESNNPAHKTVVVTVPGLILPDGREMVFLYLESNVSFPFKLEPEHQCVVWTDLKRLEINCAQRALGVLSN